MRPHTSTNQPFATCEGFSCEVLVTRGFCCLLLISLLATIASAQVSANVTGSVVDPSGSAVIGAAVTAQSLETGLTRDTTTNQYGRYQLLALPVGTYQVSVRKQGFAEEIRTGVRLVVGQDAAVNVRLRIGEVTQQIKVSGDAAVVSTSTQDISGLVGERQIKDLPLNGRSYDLLMTLNPGIVNFTWEKTGGTGVSNSTTGNNFSVSGNRPQQNIFLLNGVEFTGAAENNMTPGGTSRPTTRRRRCARVQRASRFLRRGIRQASRWSGHHCDAIRDEPTPWLRLRISPQQRSRCAQLF